MLESKARNLNLDLTVESGQLFLWNKIGMHWYGVERSNIIKVIQVDGSLEWQSYPNRIDFRSFLRFDDNLDRIYRNITKDTVITDAVHKFRGLRLIRQDPYQCLISFICATNTGIPMIRRMLSNICKTFGKKVEYDGNIFYTFPEPKVLAGATIAELIHCGVGYRARFLKSTANRVANGAIDFRYLRKASYERSKEELMEASGVGNKVADCVLLFSLEKLDSFPIDVWIARAVKKYYQKHFLEKLEDDIGTPKSYRIISSAMRSYFGLFAGYGQQYLYCYVRENWKSLPREG